MEAGKSARSSDSGSPPREGRPCRSHHARTPGCAYIYIIQYRLSKASYARSFSMRGCMPTWASRPETVRFSGRTYPQVAIQSVSVCVRFRPLTCAVGCCGCCHCCCQLWAGQAFCSVDQCHPSSQCARIRIRRSGDDVGDDRPSESDHPTAACCSWSASPAADRRNCLSRRSRRRCRSCLSYLGRGGGPPSACSPAVACSLAVCPPLVNHPGLPRRGRPLP